MLNAPTAATPVLKKLDGVKSTSMIAEDKSTSPSLSETNRNTLINAINEKFQAASDARRVHEIRWLNAYQNYRGEYGTDIVFRESEKSRVFVKITKTKVLAAYGQLVEVLFAGDRFPISVDQTKLPEGIEEFAHTELQPAGDPYGHPQDGSMLPPGATHTTLIGGALEKVKGFLWKSGPAPMDARQIQVEPAKLAAKKMEKTILDQLDEADAATKLRHACFEQVLLGTGIIKGPLTYTKTYHQWKDSETAGRVYVPIDEDRPDIEAVSCWNFYPDPYTVNINEAEYVIQRHTMTRSQLRHLLRMPAFKRGAILKALENGPNYKEQWFENQITDSKSAPMTPDRFEVLEYWGVVDRHIAEEVGIKIPADRGGALEFQVNAWICGDQVLRAVLNPYTPTRIPYLVFPYEVNPYQCFGVGVPENMRDCQEVMNGHARMAIDNLALAGNVIFEVDSAMMVPGTDMKIFPGKVFERQSGVPGQMINAINIPSTATENMQIFDRFRQLADEATGMPSYSHGQTGVNSTTRTASGMSMLMGAAALNIKTVVKNVDDYLLGPLGEALFQWNMQFNPDIEIVGDLEVNARGTSSLMQKEVRSQRLMMFAQVATQNPALMPLIKWPVWLRELAEELDIDPDKIINNPEEAALAAAMIGQMNGNGQEAGAATPPPGAGNGMGGNAQAGAGTTPSDPTGAGGGTIGTGAIPRPGEAGFTASPGAGSGTRPTG